MGADFKNGFPMAKVQPLKSIDALSGVDARMQALDKLEVLVSEVVREKARHRSNVLLKRGVRCMAQGRYRQGRPVGAEGDRGRW